MVDFPEYYRLNVGRLDSLARITHGLLENLLRQNNVDILAISSRTKSLESCLKKIRTKSYRDAVTQMTDIVGLRVIVYFEHQIPIASALIKNLFYIDEKNSYDQSEKLGSDKIGYRSNHFVCKLGSSRKHLDEYKDIFDIPFEIQVRTILQHAWAELAHDRSYKLSDGLPSEIQREVNLYAGLLEISDKAFSRIVKDIGVYVGQIADIDIGNEDINVFTLTKFVKDISKEKGIQLRYGGDNKFLRSAVQEVKDFGIQNISQLSEMIDDSFIEYEKGQRFDSDVGFLRNVMMWNDLRRYIEHSWKESWSGIDTYSYEKLCEKFSYAEEIFDRNDISAEDFDDIEFSNEEYSKYHQEPQ